MDSLTQFVLGAGVGAAVLGPRMGARQAALVGGVLGTMPDLDFLLPADGPVESYVSHRGATHSLLIQALATPLFGEAVRLAFRSLHASRWRVWAAVALCFSTHALLDSLTIYGTRLFWPLWSEPVGLGALFIIDPAYSLPLLAVTVWACFQRDWTARFRNALAAALVLTTGYIGWSVTAQEIAEDRGYAWLRAHGIEPDSVIATPAPFNTLFWRVIAVDETRHFNVYVPLIGGDGAVTAYQYTRWPAEVACWIRQQLREEGDLLTLATFTHGFYQIQIVDGAVVFADLRMGLPPSYAFRFELARRTADGAGAVPVRRIRGARAAPGDFGWLFAGIAGEAALRPAERHHAVTDGTVVPGPPLRTDC